MADYTLQYQGATIDALLAKVNSPDESPTANSDNLVESGGVKSYVDGKVSQLQQKVDEKTTFTKPVAPYNVAVFNGNRVRTYFYPLNVINKLTVEIITTGYDFGIMILDKYPYSTSSVVYYDSGWMSSAPVIYPKKQYPLANCVLVVVRKTNNAAITIAESQAAVSIKMENVYNLDEEVESIEDYYMPNIEGGHKYSGEKIILGRKYPTYNLVNSAFVPLQAGYAQQGMAIYNNYIVLGFDAQISGGNKLTLGDMDTSTIVTDIALPHDGYDALHCNSMCFGANKDNANSLLPLLYVSQTMRQRACFVYDISTSYVATLKQVILCDGISSDLMGAGYNDFIIDNENGYLYIISYSSNDFGLSITNKAFVTKIGIPALTSPVVNLTDADVLDAYEIPYHRTRQDGVIYNNRLYMIYGNEEGGQMLTVIDLNTKKEVSVVDISWAATPHSDARYEPEGLDIYDGDLVVRFLSNARNFAFDFTPE